MEPRHTRQLAATIVVFAFCSIFGLPAPTDAQPPRAWRAVDMSGVGVPSDSTAIAADLEAPVDFRTVVVAGNTVTFAWTQPPTGMSPTGYVIEGGLAPGDVLASMPTPSAITTITLSAPNGVFYVRVRATLGLTTSEASNEIQVAINVPGPPSAPAGLLGFAEGSSVTLLWQNTFKAGSPAGIALDVTSYPQPLAVPDRRAVSISLPVTDRFSFSGVPPGTYVAAVRAVNPFGKRPQRQ